MNVMTCVRISKYYYITISVIMSMDCERTPSQCGMADNIQLSCHVLSSGMPSLSLSLPCSHVFHTSLPRILSRNSPQKHTIILPMLSSPSSVQHLIHTPFQHLPSHFRIMLTPGSPTRLPLTKPTPSRARRRFTRQYCPLRNPPALPSLPPCRPHRSKTTRSMSRKISGVGTRLLPVSACVSETSRCRNRNGHPQHDSG